MEIYGYQIDDRLMDACVKRMKTGSFSAIEIFETALANGAPKPGHRGGRDALAFRFVERLLTDHRKRGLIRPSGSSNWEWRSSRCRAPE